MRVITAGDNVFFHCLVELSKNVKARYGQQLIVYDIGLTKGQAGHLDCVMHQVAVDDHYKGYTVHNGTSFINTTHKPLCIKHYFQTYDEPMIYVDIPDNETVYYVGNLRVSKEKTDFWREFWLDRINIGILIEDSPETVISRFRDRYHYVDGDIQTSLMYRSGTR